MQLVERHTQLTELGVAHKSAEAGHGGVVLVTGESGAGKTALVRHFTTQVTGSRILWGMCDELITPRPLGPFRDIATQLDNGHKSDTGVAMIDHIMAVLDASSRPTIVVVEDAHWADEATLDAIRILGRRVARMPIMLVVTFRDDETPADHQLRRALAAIPPDDLRRVPLPPLTPQGVAVLAGRKDVATLYEVTGGNPFYLTEVLAAPDDLVPRSVQESVLARINRLAPDVRECVETAAIMPGRAEISVLRMCGVADRLEDARRLGILHDNGPVVTFSHELVRRAIETGLPPDRVRTLNLRVLTVLERSGPIDGNGGSDPSRLAHHAVQAADPAAIVRHATTAARHAASLDSHREAVSHFEHALENAAYLPPRDHADLLLEYARECTTTTQQAQAVDSLSHAIAIYRQHPEAAEQLGTCLTELSDAYWYLGHGENARNSARQAVEILDRLPPSTERAASYAQLAKLAMVDHRPDDAAHWGKKAIEMADETGAVGVTIHALNTVGTANWNVSPYDNTPLRTSLDMALKAHRHKAAGRAYNNLAAGHLTRCELKFAERYIEEGLEFAVSHDLTTVYYGVLTARAEWHFEHGRWAEATRDARAVIGTSDLCETAALCILAHIGIRRGEAEGTADLAQARLDAQQIGDIQDELPILILTLESHWLHGNFDELKAAATEAYQIAIRTGVRRWVGEAALWLHRAGEQVDLPDIALEPYALQIMGHWRDAADAWRDLGYVYNEADALAESADPDALQHALEILHRLGAAPRAAMVRRELHDLGVQHIPRGPRPAARANPGGLTARQAEVLTLLAEGLTYAEIARRLHLSAKTVDHHVSAVREKLNASSRDEAVAVGRRLGITS